MLVEVIPIFSCWTFLVEQKPRMIFDKRMSIMVGGLIKIFGYQLSGFFSFFR